MLATLLLTLFACESQYVINENEDLTGSADTTADTDTGEPEPDYSEFDGATLVVISPASGDFLPYEQDATFSAEVRGADGSVLAFDDIAWTSDIDDAWALTGASVEDGSLDVGTHALTAIAQLPNGDRLAYTIGGVLVQSAYTGVYSGTLQITGSGDYNGTEYSAGCAGALLLVVDAYGDTVTGDAGCLISLLGYELDMAYLFDLENDEGDLAGATALDLTWYQLDIDTVGSMTEDGAIEGTFTQDIFSVVQIDGEFDATRISRDVSEYTDGS
jgi:hypothetical protein